MAGARTRLGILLGLALLALAGAAGAVAFKALSAEEQELLAPLSSVWEQLPPRRQQSLTELAARVAAEPLEKQHAFTRGLHRFMSLEPDKRRKVTALFRRFKRLPDSHREEIIQRVTSMAPAERHAFVLGMKVADASHPGRGLMVFAKRLSAPERQALKNKLENLSGPDKLRYLADLMEMAPDERRHALLESARKN